jgi:hypothetical protein
MLMPNCALAGRLAAPTEHVARVTAQRIFLRMLMAGILPRAVAT